MNRIYRSGPRSRSQLRAMFANMAKNVNGKRQKIKRKKDGTFAPGSQSGTQFKIGNEPWNKGVKGIHLNPETEFKKGEHVGEDHASWKGGIQVAKRDGVYLWDGANKRVRRSRRVYEEAYGEIPKGYVIYHKNGDRFDDRPENLEAISRGELAKRNKAESLKKG